MDTTSVLAILSLVALVDTSILAKPSTQGGGSKSKSRKHRRGGRHNGTKKHH